MDLPTHCPACGKKLTHGERFSRNRIPGGQDVCYACLKAYKQNQNDKEMINEFRKMTDSCAYDEVLNDLLVKDKW